jgi:tRNA/tmRNA/rRNA uracil-C5-methylase (TrmA/RlmC/RlmD family)
LTHWLEQHPDWTLASLHMLDMFPQTYHIEVLAQLKRIQPA